MILNNIKQELLTKENIDFISKNLTDYDLQYFTFKEDRVIELGILLQEYADKDKKWSELSFKEKTMFVKTAYFIYFYLYQKNKFEIKDEKWSIEQKIIKMVKGHKDKYSNEYVFNAVLYSKEYNIPRTTLLFHFKKLLKKKVFILLNRKGGFYYVKFNYRLLGEVIYDYA